MRWHPSQHRPLTCRFEDLTGESEQVIEGTDLEDNKITSNKDVAAILRRAKMWSATDLSTALAGADPMKAIGTLVALLGT